MRLSRNLIQAFDLLGYAASHVSFRTHAYGWITCLCGPARTSGQSLTICPSAELHTAHSCLAFFVGTSVGGDEARFDAAGRGRGWPSSILAESLPGFPPNTGAGCGSTRCNGCPRMRCMAPRLFSVSSMTLMAARYSEVTSVSRSSEKAIDRPTRSWMGSSAACIIKINLYSARFSELSVM
jgi:hypothetical protein